MCSSHRGRDTSEEVTATTHENIVTGIHCKEEEAAWWCGHA